MTYNAASQPTQVAFATGDSDSYTYDANTGRMTQYKFTVGATPQSLIGNLTWNANGSLASQNITDPFNSANTQNCSYTHDDLSRIASANCGAAISQTFGYDAFGNISKSGTFSFQPTYNSATNRFASIPGVTVSYDAAGNLLSDGTHSYAWDAYGKPVTVDGVGLTYDALGSVVEQNRSGSYTQFVYSPDGFKMQVMNGQTVINNLVPLVGGGMAVANSTTWLYIRHSDWLGSSRFASTFSSRAKYFDTAYAPFGEPYASSGTTDLSFTGQDSATSSGLYDFPAREYSIQGRWPSPDPAGLAAVDFSDPQSWNRYAYVLNNPLRFTDPSGLCDPNTICSTVVLCNGVNTFSAACISSTVQPWLTVSNFACLFWGGCGGSGGGGSGGGGGGGTHAVKKVNGNNGCEVVPNPLQRAVLSVLGPIANATDTTLGIGVGGSIGFGPGVVGEKGPGFGGMASRVLVISPNGQAAIVVSHGGGVVSGAGGLAGAQVRMNPSRIAWPFYRRGRLCRRHIWNWWRRKLRPKTFRPEPSSHSSDGYRWDWTGRKGRRFRCDRYKHYTRLPMTTFGETKMPQQEPRFLAVDDMRPIISKVVIPAIFTSAGFLLAASPPIRPGRVVLSSIIALLGIVQFVAIGLVNPTQECLLYKRFFKWRRIDYSDIVECARPISPLFWGLHYLRLRNFQPPFGKLYFAQYHPVALSSQHEADQQLIEEIRTRIAGKDVSSEVFGGTEISNVASSSLRLGVKSCAITAILSVLMMLFLRLVLSWPGSDFPPTHSPGQGVVYQIFVYLSLFCVHVLDWPFNLVVSLGLAVGIVLLRFRRQAAFLSLALGAILGGILARWLGAT